jgi:glycine/D-amino acid oxidase-like deaminating enzyme
VSSGGPGFWWRSVGGPPPTRPPLAGDAEADVAIVGAGYTGLWTAYYLKRAEPSLRVLVLEREHAGFGASGRNGGWVSGFFSGPARGYQARAGVAAYRALQRTMFDSVDEVGRVLGERGTEADFRKSGQLAVALDAAQAERLRRRVREARALGLAEDDLRELDQDELGRRVRVAGARAAAFTPHVARVHPVKLLLALGALVESLGVEVHERTPVREIRPGVALTDRGAVRARWVVRATEGYTSQLRGLRRVLLPLNSSMVVTAPLSAEAWEEIGWDGEELLSDEAHVYCYLQRTADGRIAIGGRGVPYRFASRTARARTSAATVASLRAALVRMFPATAGVEVEQAWSGVLGVPRDWSPSLGADARSGLAWAGGYVGEGVAASNLAARALCDLLLERSTPLIALPWVGHRPRRWEPEPLRWAGVRGLYRLYRRADRTEARSGRPSRLAGALDRVSGRA